MTESDKHKPSTPAVSRRDFLGTAITGATALTLAGGVVQTTHAARGGLPTRTLGKTGEQVSILCLGGWHIGATANRDRKEAIRIMHAAIDEGMTFFDNSWDYHDGGSEDVMGEALKEGSRREQGFLMTKGCERDYEGAARCIDDSLNRLNTDYLDLWQFHEIVYDNDPDWVFEKGGIRAAIEAQKAGKVRHIGFTGHRDPRIHKAMLDKPYDWDTVQMPINMMDAHFRSFSQEIVPPCLERNAGIIGMKSLGGGVLPNQAGIPADTCIRYALSQPVSSLVVGLMSMDDLTRNIETARDFSPMTEVEQTSLLAEVRNVAGDGRFELYKTTQRMDGPYHVKQHGFEVS